MDGEEARMIVLLLKLFAVFFQIGLFSFGGGYASLPLIQSNVVDVHKWISAEEMLDLISISQMTPGPIGINTATFVGTRIAGIPGSVFATLGLVTPSVIIVLLLSWLYYRYRKLRVVDAVLSGVRPAVVAMIASAALTILLAVIFPGSDGGILSFTMSMVKSADFIAIGIFVAALVIMRKFKLNPILVMLGSGLAGFILYKFL